MIDEETQNNIGEVHRLLLLIFDKCKTDGQLRAQRKTQQAAMELEKELKQK